jgi:ABC-type phosphate/phosphonate transport system substrate-binding protein
MPARSLSEAGFAASLPMYDLPEIAAATDELWSALAAALLRRGIAAPERLTRQEGALWDLWTAPDLLLSQTCGYPLMTRLRGKVTVLATPSYSATGCTGAYHRAAVIVGRDVAAHGLEDLRGRRCALNARDSNTGMNLLRAAVSAVAKGHAFFEAVTITGSHAASVAAVSDGTADVASVDPVTWALLQRHRPQLTGAVRVFGWTSSSPGLPLITCRQSTRKVRTAMREALAETTRAPALRALREELLLTGFETLPTDSYARILDLEATASARGYPALR